MKKVCQRIKALQDYVNEQAKLADKSSHDWGKGGSKTNEAYRSGMWYAYNDMRNKLRELCRE